MVLFRLEEVATGATADDRTMVGQAGPSTAEVRAAVEAAGGPVAAPRDRTPEVVPRAPRPPREVRSERRRRRGWGALIVTVLVLLPVIGGGYIASQAVYFIGVASDGSVAVFQGLPYDLPFGLHLYTSAYVTGLNPGAAAGRAPRPAARSQAALPRRRVRPGPSARARPAHRMRSARNRELLALVPASLLVAAGFAAIFISRKDLLGGFHGNDISNASLTYGAIFLALCLATHLVIRFTLPNADPYLFPLVALLASFGLVEIYRISDTLARQQAQWFVIGLILFAATILIFRNYQVLERYRYVIALVGIGLLVLPRLFSPVNGAYLQIKVGSLSVQPAEFSKLAIVVFLASYLRDTRQLMVTAGRRFLGLTIPPIKHFGPLLVVWGTAMLLLFFIKDIGSSVMFFGAFLAMIYVATNASRSSSSGW